MSKCGNLLNFDAKESRPSFLTPEAKAAFNCFWLTFIKALIFWYFDPEYHIWIKTDILGYAISGVLSQLIFRTSLSGVITKTNLGQ